MTSHLHPNCTTPGDHHKHYVTTIGPVSGREVYVICEGTYPPDPPHSDRDNSEKPANRLHDATTRLDIHDTRTQGLLDTTRNLEAQLTDADGTIRSLEAERAENYAHQADTLKSLVDAARTIAARDRTIAALRTKLGNIATIRDHDWHDPKEAK